MTDNADDYTHFTPESQLYSKEYLKMPKLNLNPLDKHLLNKVLGNNHNVFSTSIKIPNASKLINMNQKINPRQMTLYNYN